VNRDDIKYDLDCDDYKFIKKELGLNPEKWHRLQNQCHSANLEKLYVSRQAQIYGCQCKSVWCKDCGPRSETNTAVSAKLQKLNWRLVRHIVLTVRRDLDPRTAFCKIRTNRSIAKTMALLGCERWLWVLEFHADGFPHWHVLAENPGMIGHKKIARAWYHGLVWESYIKDERHWKGIVGYHLKKGYLAGESKQHQLNLPEYLESETSVRKYGYSMALREAKEEVKAKVEVKKSGKTRIPRSYADKFAECDSKVKICLNGVAWIEIPGPLKEVRDLFETEFDSIDYRTFNIVNERQFDTFLRIAEIGKKLKDFPDQIIPAFDDIRDCFEEE